MVFSSILETEEEDLMLDKRIINCDKNAVKHFSYDSSVKNIEAKSSAKMKITFCPTIYDGFDISDKILPPFSVSVKLTLYLGGSPDMHTITIYIVGYINGPDIDIPKEINLPNVYYGEEFCGEIPVINVDCKLILNF